MAAFKSYATTCLSNEDTQLYITYDPQITIGQVIAPSLLLVWVRHCPTISKIHSVGVYCISQVNVTAVNQHCVRACKVCGTV